MKRLVPLLLLALPLGAQPRSNVELSFDEAAESRCAGVGAEWLAELRSRMPELRSTWESIEPAMAQAVSELTRKAFSPTGKVRLTLCAVASNSLLGATVNMRYALQSFSSPPVPLRYKLDTAFHELLHEFIARNTPANSRLLAVHAAEPYCVRSHLHLLALQKAVLVRLGEQGALAQVVAIDSRLPSGCYRRAWALVNETENHYEQYVSELAQ